MFIKKLYQKQFCKYPFIFRHRVDFSNKYFVSHTIVYTIAYTILDKEEAEPVSLYLQNY